MLTLPDLAAMDLPAPAEAADYLGARVVSAVMWLLSLLASSSPVPPRFLCRRLAGRSEAALFSGIAALPEEVSSHLEFLPAGARPPATVPVGR